MSTPHLVIVGAGAAGCFAAIQAKTANPDVQVTVLEATRKPLAKVRISGGGRCNVTHDCHDRSQLIQAYPRGGKALHSLFSRFSVQDTIDWFASQGVQLKTEADGRMFPVTDDSETIAMALLLALDKLGIPLKTGCRVNELHPQLEAQHRWRVELYDGKSLEADAVLIATGSNPQTRRWLERLEQPWVEQVPSLFTFNSSDPLLDGLAGLSVADVQGSVAIKGQKKPLQQQGPWLITHWGVSGPCVLKLSAWGARAFADLNYQTTVHFDFLPEASAEQVLSTLLARKTDRPKQRLTTESPFPELPKRLWQRFLALKTLPTDLTWADCPNKPLQALAEQLKRHPLEVTGKGVFKDEFVSAGGVDLKGVKMTTLESKRWPGLFFAGEVLDIDGITGGFNFQAAWAGGAVAGRSMAGIC